MICLGSPLEKHEDLSDCEPDSSAHVRVVLVVTDLPVSPSSVVTEFCEVFSFGTDWEDVVPQSFSFSKKRAHCCTSTQEEMRYEGSEGKALPMTRRRMTPPAPLQNSYASFEGEQESYEVEGRRWTARERTIIARTKHYLEESYSVKVDVEELEDLLGAEDVGVDLRRIMKEARDDRGHKIFETFSSDGLSDFLVAEWSRWDTYKRAPWREDSSASAREGWWREDQEQPIVGWNPIDKRVVDAVEDCLENCAQVIVDIVVVENLRSQKT